MCATAVLEVHAYYCAWGEPYPTLVHSDHTSHSLVSPRTKRTKLHKKNAKIEPMAPRSEPPNYDITKPSVAQRDLNPIYTGKSGRGKAQSVTTLDTGVSPVSHMDGSVILVSASPILGALFF
ncbi:hypothetical protein AFLA_003451 [Aspergillus flavus NRRL3357]|nr:hypothetical protein AFLA_003451 [Aspergillus flavus NRRL3357]